VTKGTTKEDLFRGMEITENGELKLTDKDLLDKYKGIIPDVIKKVTESLS
jgi:hypothetical protein